MEKQLTFDELEVGQQVQMHMEAIVKDHSYEDKDGCTWYGHEYRYTDKVFTVREKDELDGTVEIVCDTEHLEYWIMPQFLIPHVEQDEQFENEEAVNHPSHYNKGKIEVIDFIDDQQLDFTLGNVLKYVCRAGHKGSATVEQDLEKALWYLQRKLDTVKGVWADEEEF